MAWPWSKRAQTSEQPDVQPAAEPVEKAGVAGTPSSGGFTSSAPTPGPTKASGSDGVASYGGFLITAERDPRLQNQSKWVTYDNMVLNIAIIASVVNVWTTLGGSAKWTAEANPKGGEDGRRAADLVTEGLLEAQTSKPWSATVRRQLMKKFRGFALHEGIIRRRPDGKVVFGDIQDRPQWTVWRWNKPDEQSAWEGVEQLTRTGGTFYIPRERLFYSVEDTLTASPDGVGVLRQLAEPVRVLELYQQWEGIGFQTDLRGIPIARAPIGKLRAMAESDGAQTEKDIMANVMGQAKFLTDFLRGHNKRSDQGVLLDSLTYTDKGPTQAPSSVNEWAFDLLKGASSGMPEIGAAIGRLIRDIARVVCAEWLLLGGEDSGGAYSMHEDKTAMFALMANGALTDVAEDARRDLAARLVALNGLDPETCTPKLIVEPIASGAVESSCKALMMLFQAGLNPKDPAINILRGRLDLPPAPEIDETDWLLPRGANLDVLSGGGTTPVPGTAATPGTAPGRAPAPGAPGQAGNVNARPDQQQPEPGAKP